MNRTLTLSVPTYYATAYITHDVVGDLPDYDSPNVPVLVHQGEAVRLVLGAHDIYDSEKPDILIERRPKGWAIFLHPVGSGDPSGVVFFLDDGRSFVLREDSSENPGCVQVLLGLDAPPELDKVDLPQPFTRLDKSFAPGSGEAAASVTLREPNNRDSCARCGQSDKRNGDWHGELCPTCADETDGDWACSVCGRRGTFEAMGGDGAANPICCQAPCQRLLDADDPPG
jgi:hypothetical protein